MKKKTNYKKLILARIRDINTCYPDVSFNIHLAIATQEYDDLGSITDKEMLFLLDKYKNILDLEDSFHTVNQCTEDMKHLSFDDDFVYDDIEDEDDEY